MWMRDPRGHDRSLELQDPCAKSQDLSFLPAGDSGVLTATHDSGLRCRVVPLRAANRHASRLLVATGAVSQLSASSSAAASAATEGTQHLADRLLGMYVLADVNAAAAASTSAPTRAGGWFAPLADALESVLKVVQTGLDQVHVPYSYGYSIILLTLFVKLVTYPLAKQQVPTAGATAGRTPGGHGVARVHTRSMQLQHAGW